MARESDENMSSNRIKKMEIDELIEFTKTKKYEYKGQCGKEGSFGVTVKVYDPTIEEYFAIKKYAPQENINPKDFYDNFKNEIKLMHNIFHPNIVRLYNYHLYPEINKGYIVMEYIDGVTIDTLFVDLFFGENDDDEQIISKIFENLISAFAYLEENGIIHRDIRERNILITENYEPKLIDFGFGKVYEAQGDSIDSKGEINRNGLLKLPKEYREGKYTSLTDMFYLGELFKRLLSSYSYYDSFEFKDVLEKMIETNPEDRYSSFSDILEIIKGKTFKKILKDSKFKKAYQVILNPATEAIVCIKESYTFCDLKEFINGLKNLLEVTQFEDVLYDHEIGKIIIKSSYTYHPTYRSIEYNQLDEFYNWISKLDEISQDIVFRNIKHKFVNSCKLVYDELDLPF